MLQHLGQLSFCTILAASPLIVNAKVLSRDEKLSTFQDCLSPLKPVYQSSPDYAVDSAPFNQRFSYKPIALVYPGNANDVSLAVKCAAAANYKVSARSGGHSYAAYGLGGEDGQLIISLEKLDYVKVDTSSGKASIGGGTRLGNVALGLWNQGKRAMPHGTCREPKETTSFNYVLAKSRPAPIAFVGVGGHFSLGGFGLDSRLWGLALDNVEEITIVKADGAVSTVSANNEAPLYWAMRGAAPSFAIATEFKVKTYAAPPQVLYQGYEFTFGSSQASTDAFLAYQQWAANDLPPELGPQVTLTPGKFKLNLVYYGADAQAKLKTAAKPLLDALYKINNKPKVDSWTGDYIYSVKQLTGSPNASLNTTGAKDSQDTFFATALYVQENNLLTKESVTSFFDYIYDAGAKSDTVWFIQADIWGGKSSAINKIGQDDTSFWTRNALYGWQLYASTPNYKPPYPDRDIQFVQGFKTAIKSKMPGVTWTEYPNYVDSTLTAAQAHDLYYAGHLRKLQAIKTRVDPNNIFTNPQAIGR